MLTIDGSAGEGGGQILRTSLALSAITGTPFRVTRIRARRDKPGLRRQHQTAVLAAAAICGADVAGAEIGSAELTFRPGQVQPGAYDFDIGSAGSTALVLQTVLPPLFLAGAASRVLLIGGTHNPKAPPFDFLAQVFVPLVNRMGPRVDLHFEQYGFYPRGGGRFTAHIEPAGQLTPLELVERGEIRRRLATATVVGLPEHIGKRELAVVGARLDWPEDSLRLHVAPSGYSRGNVLTIAIESEQLTELFSAIGERGVPAERVAAEAAQAAAEYLATGAPVGPWLADQLLVPLALAGGGSFVTGPLTLHSTTNIDVIHKFLDVRIDARAIGEQLVLVEVAGGA